MRYAIAILALAFTTTACEKDRAGYRDDIATAICAEMQQCDKIGPDGRFQNFDDCVTDMSSRYNNMWSAKRCEQRIDATKFAACKKRAVTNACEGNVLDKLSFSIECGANDVCVAEPPAEGQ